MDIDEARRVARIVKTADGGCPSCVGALFEKLAKEFPQFSWATARVGLQAYGGVVPKEKRRRRGGLDVVTASKAMRPYAEALGDLTRGGDTSPLLLAIRRKRKRGR
jgi:hypothetical protein